MFRIISGGQTGVDRAALDVALRLGIPAGGWCPLGRLAEDGIIPPHYPLRETPLADSAQRTEWNVRDGDGTLVLTRGAPRGGTAFTIACAAKLRRPHLVVDLLAPPALPEIVRWVKALTGGVVNVAGPKESEAPGVYAEATQLLEVLLRAR